MNLRELFEVMWSITELSITARNPDGHFLHKWIYGPDIHESIHQYHDRMDGKLTIIDGKINAHGDPTRGGSEIGWGVKEKLFPKDMLTAPIRHMGVISRGNEYSVRVDVEMQELMAMTLIERTKEENRE